MKFTETIEYHRLQCSECGVVYFFPERWVAEAKAVGRTWRCPNGHGQCFGESDNNKLRRERDRLKQQTARLNDEIRYQRESREATERQLSAQKGQMMTSIAPWSAPVG